MTKIPLVAFGVLLILIFATYLWWSSATSARNSKDTTQKPFLITRGESVQSIAGRLQKDGLIKNTLAFRLWIILERDQTKIKAGNYRLSPGQSLEQIVTLLVSGPKELWVTYPEGLRREELIDKTVSVLNMDTAQAQKFAQDFWGESKDFEGQLFPDTYLFAPDVSAATVAQKLKSTFDAKVTSEMRNDVKKNGLTLSQTLVLASIIERETKTDAERPVVAGILLKRLKTPGWLLQTDATLQYIVGSRKCQIKTGNFPFGCNWWETPDAEDKKLKSSFNTYISDTLPPSPICNPGLSAIKAAIYPEDSDYWFYLHGKDGQIHYARTSEEHQENIQKYLY